MTVSPEGEFYAVLTDQGFLRKSSYGQATTHESPFAATPYRRLYDAKQLAKNVKKWDMWYVNRHSRKEEYTSVRAVLVKISDYRIEEVS